MSTGISPSSFRMTSATLIIDTSYYVFHRYYATLRWYTVRNQDKGVDHSGLLENTEFIDAFFRHLDKDFRELRLRYNVPHHKHILLCCDCPRSAIWRCELYASYKQSRKHAETFQGGIFQMVYNHFSENLEKLNVVLLSHDRLEADDIAYVCQKWLLDRTDDTITILANDNDYQQVVGERVNVVNKEGKEIKQRGCGCPRKDMMRKVLMGDKSDNIPAVYKGVGPKTADQLLCMSEDDLESFLKRKGAWDTYQLNLKLICWDFIPNEYTQDVVCQLEKMKII